ncbi:MAG: sensor histidine kinase [Burkholderiaceae bacterium]
MLWACGLALAQTPVRLEPQAGMISLSGRMSWLIDKTGSLTIYDASMASGWQPLPNDLHAGLTDAAVWLRVDVDQPDARRREWLVEFDNALLDDVLLYQQNAAGQWAELHAGRSVRHSAWPLDTRSPTFHLELPPGRHPLIMRLQARTPLFTAVRLWQPDNYNAMARTEALALGMYIGVFAMLAMFHLFFWISTREAVSGAYVIYGSVLFLISLMSTGYAQNVLDMPSGSTSIIFGLALAVITLAGTRYIFLQLELVRIMPRFNRLFLLWIGGISFTLSALILTGRFPIAVGLAQIFSNLWAVSMLILSYILVRRRHELARIFVLAFSILIISLITRILRNFGIFESNLIVDYILQACVILHLIVISQSIISRYNTLKRALVAEQKTRQEQQEFVGMVSHEFRTPLAIINTSIEQLAANVSAPVEKTLNRCTNIRNAARRMSDLMDEYLSQDRLESSTSTGSLKLQSCNLLELLEDSAADLPMERIRLTARDLPETFVCDPHLLQIALRNLLANARRHSPEETVIEFEATGTMHGGLLIAVTDHGEGIAPDEMKRLFQKYFRGRSAIGKPGAGLGLFMVNRITELHGGRIEVKSVLGAGSTFEMHLPAIPLL